MLCTSTALSAKDDFKKIYDNKDDEKPTKEEGEETPDPKKFIRSHEIKKSESPKINESIGNDSKSENDSSKILEDCSKKIAGYYKESVWTSPFRCLKSWNSFRDIYNKNCEPEKTLGFFDCFKAFKDPEDYLESLMDNLKPDSKNKVEGIMEAIKENPQLLESFARDPSKINDLMGKCNDNKGNIDVITETIKKELKSVESKDPQQNNNEKAINIKDLLNNTPSQEADPDNSAIPKTNGPAKNNQRQ